MTTTQTRTRRARGRRRTAPAPRPAEARAPKQPAGAPVCMYCRKTGDEVTFAIAGAASCGNICEACAAECVRVFARTCVC